MKEYLFHQTIKGLKTETRRSIYVPAKWELEAMESMPIQLDKKKQPYLPLTNGEAYFPKPKYQEGGIYYLKEPYSETPQGLIYKYDYAFSDPVRQNTKWKNKLFMPAAKARHFIQIKGVSAEQLQAITPASVIAEGVHSGIGDFWDDRKGKLTMRFYASYGFNKRLKKVKPYEYEAFGLSGACFTGSQAHRHAFESLINRINGPRFWEENPMVWKYKYKCLTKVHNNEKQIYTASDFASLSA